MLFVTFGDKIVPAHFILYSLSFILSDKATECFLIAPLCDRL